MIFFIDILAILSIAAAGGMRIALPLLIIGLLHTDQLWSKIPLLSQIHPQVLVAVLTSWSLFELLGSKKLIGQRILQIVQLVLSPLVGALLAITLIRITGIDLKPVWLVATLSGGFAALLKMVEVGWFFRLQGLPIGVILAEDLLCVILVLFAFDAPKQGGLIAMLLFWIALRSTTEWRNWQSQRHSDKP